MGDVNNSKKDAYLYRLRGNSILNWVEDLKDINKYKRIIKECTLSSEFEIESGIVKINPNGYYIGHKFVPQIKAGFNFQQISTIMKFKIIEFESLYGKVNISNEEIEDLQKIVYEYNQTLFINLDMSDNKKLIHLKDTAEVLSYVMVPSIILKNEKNGWCTLTFTKNDNNIKDYCTIFTEEQIKILQKVNNSIR